MASQPLSDAAFAQLLEAAPDAMVIVDHAGRIVLVNAQAERLFGRPRAAMLGGPLEMLLPKRYRLTHEAHRAVFFKDPRLRPMGAGLELRALRADGTEIPVEISLSPLQTEEGTLVTAAIRDVTERRRAERAMRAQTLARPLVVRIMGALLERVDTPDVVVAQIGRDLAREIALRGPDEYAEAFTTLGLGTLALQKREGDAYTFEGDDLLGRVRRAAQPTCHLARGFLEGAVSTLHGRPALGAEVKCQSQGHPKCVFVVRPR